MSNSSVPNRARRIIQVLVAALFAAGVTSVVTPAYACACGAFAPPVTAPTDSIQMNQEMAAISWSDGRERIDMRLGVDSMTKETGLIFPTPSPADVSLGDVDDFGKIEKEMTPDTVTNYEWWSSPWNGFMSGSADGGAAPGTQQPQILSEVQLGPIHATTLAASDADGLTAWLDENGYGLRPEVTNLLSGYVDQGWAFVAMKLTGDTPLDGDLDPITFVFDSDRLVYPLALSKAATTSQQVYLYVFSDHRQSVLFDGGKDSMLNDSPDILGEILWARSVRDQDLQARGVYLTAFSLLFDNPGSSIKGDLVMEQAPTDDEVNTVVYDTVYVAILGIPVGWLLVVVAAIGVPIALSVLVRARNRRRSSPMSPQ